MPDCNYCEASFEDEQAYLEHLQAEHEDELGSIDRRRIEENLGGDGGVGLPTGPLVLGFVLLVAVVIVAYVIFFAGASGPSPAPDSGGSLEGAGEASLDRIAQSPGQLRSAHEHGTMDVSIDGQRIDFSQSEYQLAADKFHFESGNGRVWHKHATGVTLEWAIATLGIGVSEDTVVYDGTVYSDSDPGTNVTVEVDGQPVDPQTYVLQGGSDTNPEAGDSVRIVVETGQ